MRIYIASRYKAHSSLNRIIRDALEREGFSVFLPEDLHIDEIDDSGLMSAGWACYRGMLTCDVFVVVAPYGESVAAEIGAAAVRRVGGDGTIRIILYAPEGIEVKREAMTTPFFDLRVSDVHGLIAACKFYQLPDGVETER